MNAPPDPAFDWLLPTLKEMTTAPIMLPTTLPPQLRTVVIGDDTQGDQYSILFLNPRADTTRMVQPIVNATVRGVLRAEPVDTNSPLDPGTSPFVDPLGNVTLPDGNVARLWWIERPGGNAGPASIGTFEVEGERYNLEIRVDSLDGAFARQILSTMVRVSP
jgi:hypothetical protein